MISSATNTRMSLLAFATAAVTLVGGALLIATFILEIPFNGPYNFGRPYDAVSALGGVLIAALVLPVSRPAARSLGSRVFVFIVALASLIGAVPSILLLVDMVSFETSAAVSIVVLILQAVWMLWLNTRLSQLGVFSRLLSRCGQLVGAGILVGLLIVGVSAVLPWLTLPQVLALGLGIFIAGGVWLVWPFWFVMLGWHLRTRPTASAASSAARRGRGRRRGRRSATRAR